MSIERPDASNYLFRQVSSRKPGGKRAKLAGKDVTLASDKKKPKAAKVAPPSPPQEPKAKKPIPSVKKREREEKDEAAFLSEIQEMAYDPAKRGEIAGHIDVISKQVDLKEKPKLNALVERYYQLENLPNFEKQPMTCEERLQLAYHIEILVPKVKSAAKGTFVSSSPKAPSKTAPAPPRDYIITKKGRIVLLAKPELSQIASRGSWKEVYSAVKLYKVGTQVLSKKTGILKTVKTVTPSVQAVIPLQDKEEAKNVKREMDYYLRFKEKKVPGIAKLRVFMDITGKKSSQEDYVRVLKPMEGEKFTFYRVGVFDKYDGSLEKKMDLSLDATLDVMKQVVTTVKAIHDEKVIHGDLKLENILYKENEEGPPTCALIDFGLSFDDQGDETVLPENSYSSGSYGTNFATAPELIGKTNFKGDIYKTEVWALGVAFLELHSKTRAPWRKHFPEPPERFNEMSEKEQKAIMKKVSADVTAYGKHCAERIGQLEKKKKLTKEEEVELLLCKMLHIDPDERISLQEVQRVLASIA